MYDGGADDTPKKPVERLPSSPEKSEEETRPCFTFGLRPRAVQTSNSVKLICCLQGNPTPQVSGKAVNPASIYGVTRRRVLSHSAREVECLEAVIFLPLPLPHPPPIGIRNR